MTTRLRHAVYGRTANMGMAESITKRLAGNNFTPARRHSGRFDGVFCTMAANGRRRCFGKGNVYAILILPFCQIKRL